MTEGVELPLHNREWRRRNSLWILPTVLCCGFLTWASFLYVGVRAKRGSWLTAAAIYGVAVIAYFVLIETAPRAPDGTTDTSGWQSTVGTLCFLAVWFGGTVHALIINSQWLAFLESPQDHLASTPWFPTKSSITPGALEEPWQSFVSQALTWQRNIDATVAGAPPGPMQARLQDLAGRVDTGITECWKLAQGGQALTRARALIDTGAIARELSHLQQTNPSLTEATQALQAQLDTATRIEADVSSTYDGLLVLNARLGEISARVIELSARPFALTEADAVDSEVESVVDQLVAIRQALTEMDGPPSVP